MRGIQWYICSICLTFGKCSKIAQKPDGEPNTGKKPENRPIFNFRKIGKNTYITNFDLGFELVPCQQLKLTPPVEKS